MKNFGKVTIERSGVWLLLFFIGIFYGCQDNVFTTDILIENDQIAVRINPVGAELQSIVAKASNREYLWQGDSSTWADRSPIMFPVNVRFRDELFTYRGDTFEMPRMGLAIKASFDLVDTTKPDQCLLRFESDANTLQYYPFPFHLEVRYALEGTRLLNEFTVTNKGTDTMYFALGGHPGFRFPFENYPMRQSYSYSFSEPMTVSRIEIRESLVQPNVIPFLNGESRLPLVDDRIPSNGSGMFLKDVQARRIGLSIGNRVPFIEVDLGDFPNVNLWSPPGRQYACIEPMLSHHDLANAPLAIEEKSHLVKLPPGQKDKYQFAIIIYVSN